MVFSKFHYISEKDLHNLNLTYEKLVGNINEHIEELKLKDPSVYYRNWDNPDELRPQATLMAYNSEYFHKIISVFVFISFTLLF